MPFDFFTALIFLLVSLTSHSLNKISQRVKIVVHALAGTVHIIVDSDKADTLLREQHFCIKPHLQVISPQPRHILDDHCAYFPGFNVRKHGLKTGSLEVCPGIPVIGVPAQIGKSILFCVGFEYPFLVRYGIALSLQVIVFG